MKQHALAIFRKTSEHLNCAQAVLSAWHTVSGDTTLALAGLKACGGGHAPEGICGALHTACRIAPDRAAALKTAFIAHLGSAYCKELRAAKVHSCDACVAFAAELLEPGARKNQPDPSQPKPLTKLD
jgi:hypothetical protein